MLHLLCQELFLYKLLHSLVQVADRVLARCCARWALVYTSSSQVLMLMNAIRQIPLIEIKEISQSVEAETAIVRNKVRQCLQKVHNKYPPLSSS